MPGKYIDRIVFTIIGAAFFYLFFLNAWGNIPLACMLSFICCALAARLIRRRPVRFKCTSAEANEELLRIAATNDTDAAGMLEALVRKRHPDEAFILFPCVRHPSSTLSVGDVFNAWKRHRSKERLLIVCTCGADPRAIAYARELASPRIAVIERKQLLRIIRTAGIPGSDRPRVSLIKRLKRIPGNISLRCGSPKNALMGLLLVGFYTLSGNILYLLAGLLCLFRFGCSLPGMKFGRRLF